MRRTFLFFFLLFHSLQTFAQERRVFLFTKDSIGNQSPGRWLFANSDKPEYASPAFDDRALVAVYTGGLRSTATGPTLFKGLGWLRLHFRVDSGLAGKPLAIGISQAGASELYLDGRKIYSRGVVGDAKTSDYYDPQYYPFPLVIPDTAEHLLAIRYANWNYNNQSYLYRDEQPGFQFTLKEADTAFHEYNTANDFTAITCCVLFGIFAALAIIHCLFFLYYKSERSNLWFGLFCASVSLLFLAPFVGRTTSSPETVLVIEYYSFFIAALAFFALSGSLNQLFSRKRLRFYIISIFYLLASLLYIFVWDLREYLIFAVLIVAMVEAMFVIIAAIIRKVPGARIIGAGLALFILLILFLLGAAIFNKKTNFQLTGTIGGIVIGLISAAILSIPISLSAFLARNFAAVSRDLKRRLQQVEELSRQTLEQEAEKKRILEHQKEDLEREVTARTGEVMRQKKEIEAQNAALVEEKKKSDDLLLNILPAEVAEELKQKGSSAARQYEHVSVMFTDFVDFTGTAEQLNPQKLVTELNACFTAFDAIIERNGLEKIKTIGDAYMAVCGLPVSDPRHAQKTVQAALEIRDFMEERKKQDRVFEIRIGINSGPVVAGIIGVKKFAYDIWGDTVNTANRMEQHGEPARINISQSTYELVKNDYQCDYRGKIAAKNKGEVEMYFVETAVRPI